MRVAFNSIRHVWLQIAAAAALLGLPALASAQTPLVGQNSAVVTGFSQATISTAPPGADPYDYYMVNPNGPSARVVDLTNVGAPGVVAPAVKTFTALASQVGQVFGATLDSAVRPNIYVAATSAYGLQIVTPDPSGQPHRVHTGTIGASYAFGQFGPSQLGGGSGSIWRIDGTTGVISLFANVPNAGPASLGGLAFDATTQTVFVADRTSGKIYRYGTNGALKGSYDHGTEGRPSAGLPPIGAPAVVPVNIQSPSFDTENPNTWGSAPAARRVFGLAVYKNRLYYGVFQGPQVWSAGIGAGGSIGGKDARMEVELPSLDSGIEIAGIDFDAQGFMYVAERGETTGDYFLIRLANDGQSRVVRYRPKLPGDPSPGLWSLIPDQYSIGMPPNYTNADGGVALHYGYRFDGTIDLTACKQTVWASGERLMDPGDGSAGFMTVDGIQGTNRALVQPQNVPPTQSWYIDYDDGAGYADFRGHMGAIATRPCPVAQTPPPPPPPPVLQCPPGTYFDGQQCIIIPSCPPGTSYANGQCIYPTCPPGFILNQQGQCVPPPQTCPQGTYFYQGQCVPLACPQGMLLTPKGECACPQGTFFFNGKCVPPQQCPPNSVQLGNGICICPLGLIFGNGVCTPSQQGCPANQELWNGYCVAKCPPNQIHTPPNGKCEFPPVNCPPTQDYFNGLCVNKCPVGQEHTLPDGKCKMIPVSCPPSQELFNNLCVNKCPGNQIHTLPNGQCIPPPNCPQTQELWNGICVNKCVSNFFQHSLPNGSCVPIFTVPIGPIQELCLGVNKELWDGKCVDKCPGNQVHTQPNGACKPPFVGPLNPNFPVQILCLGANKEVWENKCVNVCPAGQVHTQPNGDCKKVLTLPPNIGPIIGNPPLQISPAAQCALLGKDLYKGNCVDKCTGNQVHKDPAGACGPPVLNPNIPIGPIGPIQPLNPAALCAAQNKDLFNGNCVNKCGPNQEHKQPNGACGPVLGPIVPLGPNVIQIIPTQATCNAQNKDLYNGQCVNKCGPNQEHKPPNGACGPAGPVQINPGVIQIIPTQATCNAQNKDLFEGKCIDKCGPNQEHKQPNGACGPTNAGPIQINPGVIQVIPTQATCNAQNKDLFEGKCIDKCGPNQEHKQPNGACGPTNAGPIQINPGVIQVVPTQATCNAQNKDLFEGKCIDKCGANQEHKQPNGACGPTNAGPIQINPGVIQVIPTQATCNAQNKDLFEGKCIDKCGANQEHKQPNGACGPINVQLQVVPTSAQCAAQNRDLVGGKCVDKCKDDEIRNDKGMCVDRPRLGGGARGGG